MIKQCKGKDLIKVPKSKLGDRFYLSTKYDGHYVQIHKLGDKVKFYTSGGKQFYVKNIADELLKLNPNTSFVLEAEYINTTDGKLGSRGYSAKLTTYRTNFSKGIETNAIPNERFMVFDIIYCADETTSTTSDRQPFSKRLEYFDKINLGTNLVEVEIDGVYTLDDCKNIATTLRTEGYEGAYIKSPDHIYYEGKRVNDAIKLKPRPTADLLCVDVTEGDGKYIGMIGSLVLVDAYGRQVSVGSGLSDVDRAKSATEFINKIIEIEYEQILDTYIQPTYVRVRHDKTKEEID